MGKVLSQEEIDALLRGVDEGKVDTQTEALDEPRVAPFDFASQDRIIRGRMPTLEIVDDRFAKLLKNDLSSALRKIIDVEPKGIQFVKFGDFLKTLPIPSSLHIFKMDPLRGHALLVLESKLVFTLLDVFFGGSGKTAYKIEGREFTAIESRLIQKVVAIILKNLDKAWDPVHSLTFQYIRGESNSQFATIVLPSDIVVIISFGVGLDQFSGMITLCIPYSVIEPIKDKLYSGYQSDQLEVDRSWMRNILNRLKGSEVELKVELGRSQIMIQDLLQLKVGDVLPLGKEVAETLVVKVGGIAKFLGKAGVYGANKAIQIEGRMNPERGDYGRETE